MKLNERGRGKFKPAPDYDIDEVKRLLFEKIEEERSIFTNEKSSFQTSDLHYKETKLNLLSLFSGCGGLDLGFKIAGIEAVFGKEKAEQALKDKYIFNDLMDESIFNTIYANDIFTEALESYRTNFSNKIFIDQTDIRKVKDFPKADIVLGGFPCPGFSEAGPRLIDDERNFLYIQFIRCLMQSKPLFFVAENVKGMMTLGKGEVFKQIVQDFEAAGYTVYHDLLNARDFGVPQLRERVILVGVRNDLDYEYPKLIPTHGEGKIPFVTLRDAIGDLENDPGEYFEGSYSSIFMSRNRKKNWEDQSFTIQASGRQAPIHPGGVPMQKVESNKWIFPDGEENNRRLSVKEIKRIQTFPDWYYLSSGQNTRMSKNGQLDKIYKQVGNAVPVLLARAVALPLARWAVEHKNQIRELSDRV